MALKSLLSKSTDTLVETVKSMINFPTVAELEAEWIEAEAAVDRALSVFDESPDATNRAALQAARSSLTALEDPLASARRREVKRHEKFMTAKAKAERANKAEAIKAAHVAVHEFDEVLVHHLEPAGKKLMAALSAANALGDSNMCSAVATIVYTLPWCVNYRLRDFQTVKQVPLVNVETLAQRLSGFPTIEENGEQ